MEAANAFNSLNHVMSLHACVLWPKCIIFILVRIVAALS